MARLPAKPTKPPSVAIDSAVKLTADGGLAVRMRNDTGAKSVLGSIVAVSSNGGSRVALAPASGTLPVGVMLDHNVADGSLVWVSVAGKAKVLFKNGVAPVAGQLAYVSDTAGRAACTATSGQWGEIGHVLESHASGTDVRVLCVLHFN